MNLKIDKVLFFLSLNIFLFYFSINYIDRLRYILLLIVVLTILVFYKKIILALTKIKYLISLLGKKTSNLNLNNNVLNNLKILILTIIIAAVIGRYDIFLIKSYISSSQLKVAMYFTQEKDNLFIEEKDFNKEVLVNKQINENYKILIKREGDSIRLINNELKDERFFFNKSSSNMNLIPFYLFPNGNLLVSSDWWFESQGLYKVDKNFNILWNLDKPVHHYAALKEDKIYVPSFSFVRWNKFKKGELYAKFKDYNCNKKVKKVLSGDFYNDDIITPSQYEEGQIIRTDEILSVNTETGSIIKKIDLLKIMSEDKHLLNVIHQSTNSRCIDLLHLNDVVSLNKNDIINLLPIETLNQNKNLSDNIFLLSFRDINTIAIFDFDNEKFLWSVTGLTRSQHSPRLLKNGNILVYDNYTYEHNGSNFGISSLKEINIKTKKIVSSFSGNEKKNLATIRRGRLQIKDDTVYVLASDQEKFYEVKCTSKRRDILLSNCNIELIYSFSQNKLFENTIFMSDLYQYVDGKYYLLD